MSLLLVVNMILLNGGADSLGHGGTATHFYKWLGTGGTMSRRTANKKLTKLC